MYYPLPIVIMRVWLKRHLLNYYFLFCICSCTEDNNEDLVKQRLNQKFIQTMQGIHARRMREVPEQQREEREEELQRQLGKKMADRHMQKTKDQKSQLSEKYKRSLKDEERDIHEAYQILCKELDKRQVQRQKQSRILAIKQQQQAEALAPKSFWRSLQRVSIKQLS